MLEIAPNGSPHSRSNNKTTQHIRAASVAVAVCPSKPYLMLIFPEEEAFTSVGNLKLARRQEEEEAVAGE